LPTLKVDFYESGIGDTIVITFPSGGLGLVDAHPSPHDNRPDILRIVAGKRLHFVCLTHPHADHGIDLVPVLNQHPAIESFWHTTSDVRAFIYRVQETQNFPSAVREFASRLNQDWANFLLDLFGAVAKRQIPRHLLRSNVEPSVIDGVEVHCLSPEEQVQNRFFAAYANKLGDPKAKVPDTNLLSAVLALRFGQSVVLLGADALKENWDSTVKRFHKRLLPKARVIKIPHHGARNSFNLQRHATTYLDICSRNPKAKSVLFAGDAKHPDGDVYAKLRERTEVFCLSNGRKPNTANFNPLRLQMPGARAVYSAPICNVIISFELDADANVTVLSGVGCDGCGVLTQHSDGKLSSGE
jgi:hypothetical protein